MPVEPGSESPPPNLNQIGSIQDLDTARMALRWALERISALQAAQQAQETETEGAQGELRLRKASEALARWEAVCLQSYLLRLIPIPGVAAEDLGRKAEELRAEFEKRRRDLGADASERAKEALENLRKREERFNLWRQFVEGRVVEESARHKTEQAAGDLSRELVADMPAPAAPAAPAAADTATALESLAGAWASQQATTEGGPLTKRFEALIRRRPLPSVKEFLWTFETWEMEQFARRKALQDLIDEGQGAPAGGSGDAALKRELEEARRGAESLSILAKAAEADALAWRQRAEAVSAVAAQAESSETLAQALRDRLRQKDKDLSATEGRAQLLELRLADMTRQLEHARREAEKAVRAQSQEAQAVRAELLQSSAKLEAALAETEALRERLRTEGQEAVEGRSRVEELENQLSLAQAQNRIQLEDVRLLKERVEVESTQERLLREVLARQENDAAQWKTQAAALQQRVNELTSSGARGVQSEAVAEDLRSKLRTLETEAATWKGKAAALEDEAAAWRDKSSALESASAGPAAKAQEDRLRLREMESQIADWKTKVVTLQQRVAELAHAEAEGVHSAAVAEDLREKMRALEEEAAAWKGKAAALESEAAAWKRKTAALESDGPASKVKLEGLGEKLRTIEIQAAEWKAKAMAQQARITELISAGVNGLPPDALTEDLRTRLRAAEALAEEWKVKADALQKRVTELALAQAGAVQASAAVEEMRLKLQAPAGASADANEAALRSQLWAMESQASEWKAKAAALETRVAELLRQVDNLPPRTLEADAALGVIGAQSATLSEALSRAAEAEERAQDMGRKLREMEAAIANHAGGAPPPPAPEIEARLKAAAQILRKIVLEEEQQMPQD